MTSPFLLYLAAVRDRWRWPAWGVLICTAAVLVVYFAAPLHYRSTATVFIRTPGDVSHAMDGGDTFARHRVDDYAVLAGSRDIAARVVDDLGLEISPDELAGRVSAAVVPETALIRVDVGGATAEEANETARVFLAEYAAKVRELETVSGSVVPRAELVVVDSPAASANAGLWGVPIPILLLGAVIVGSVLGALGAVIRMICSDTTRDPRDAEAVSGRPVVGPITGTVGGPVTDDARIAVRGLISVMGEPEHGVVVVTGVGPETGAMEAAAVIAAVLHDRSGSSLLVDLDLRTRQATTRLGGTEERGVSDVLTGSVAVTDAVDELRWGPFLAAGRPVPDVAEMIDSRALSLLVGELSETYRWVILCCSPILLAADASVLAESADALIVAAVLGETGEKELRDACAVLPARAVSVIALVRPAPRAPVTTDRTQEEAEA